MHAEATSDASMSSTSAPAVVGRSLGRAARFATVWLGAASASVETMVERARGKRSLIPPAALGAGPLIEELAALVQAQPAGESAALASNDKFWSLVEQLYAVRYMDAPEPAPATGVVAAKVVEAAASKGTGKRAAKSKAEASAQAEPAGVDASSSDGEAAAMPKDKDTD